MSPSPPSLPLDIPATGDVRRRHRVDTVDQLKHHPDILKESRGVGHLYPGG